MEQRVKKFVCICCPIGCKLEVTVNGGEVSVSGNTCVRGKNYGISEVTAPTRTVTSTVKLVGGEVARLPVKTASPIPKDRIFAALFEIKSVIASAPMKIGDIIIRDVAGTGVSVVATRDVCISGEKS